MPLQIRRVVTGHDSNGKAIVTIDEIAQNVIAPRPNVSSAVIWSTEGFPVDNDGDEDPATLGLKNTTLANGTVFRVLQVEPGNAPRMHRTDSVDYALVLSGEIDMELDDGVMVHLKAGDVMVQRGTVHNWLNRGTAPCVIAFILISAKSVTAGGKTLATYG